ncbi:MAG: pre-16S rRNA-processing nuclease YqgF [Phascolarctobacterium sp.]|uniref:pre-16S rRNA-processing nuclease YqgF n=1 Tax=Phascolarctobacterium sp. TaxID=2049039 RepID=UPI0026DCDC81|nr:pre-16S rRNA-processing nuclease YqgF [Phascolarctobacterium sp.]MDO4921751.1 pre-16S rRNA-processing nuclease YqgF [Phascolarctobacterium sp.]
MNKYLGIDPGRSKTGLALVAADGSILALHIAATDSIASELRTFIGQERPAQIIMGNGTNSKAIGAAVRKAFPDAALALVGEAHSTEEARSLYWQENPPHGWRKLLPLGLQVPPEPLDAYAAVVQVRRWLAQSKSL